MARDAIPCFVMVHKLPDASKPCIADLGDVASVYVPEQERMRRDGLNCRLPFDENPCSFTFHTLPGTWADHEKNCQRCIFSLEAPHGVRLYLLSHQHLASGSKSCMAISRSLSDCGAEGVVRYSASSKLESLTGRIRKLRRHGQLGLH